jgi:hypothetical protein
VKAELRELLTSEMVLVSDMHHEGEIQVRTVEDEGSLFFDYHYVLACTTLIFVSLPFVR